jgi:nitrate reductase NapE component
MMPSRRSVERWPLALLAVGVFALSSCSSSGGTGTVNGIFQTSGGPPGYQPHRLPGNVVFSDSKGDRASVRVGASGALVVHLLAGTYTAVGHSPMVHSGSSEMACDALKPVVVRAGQTQSVTVACQLM